MIILSRNCNVTWNDREGMIQALNGADLVINLAGKSVDCRYNLQNKNEILRSRVDTTHAIGNCISECTQPPRL